MSPINISNAVSLNHMYYYDDMRRHLARHYIFRCLELKPSYRFQTLQQPQKKVTDLGNDVSRSRF